MFASALLIVSILTQSFRFIEIHLKTRLLLYGLNTTLVPPFTRLSACLLILLNVAVLTLLIDCVGPEAIITCVGCNELSDIFRSSFESFDDLVVLDICVTVNMTHDAPAQPALPRREMRLPRLIDKTHLRATKQITSYLQQSDPNITEEQVRVINRKRPKDNYKHDPRRYQYPIFADHHHAFQMDLLEQSRNRGVNEGSTNQPRPDFPPYYLILLNINTRYAYAIPVESKTKEVINDKLKAFIATTPIGISLRIITDQRHTALALIDRFIRTLRDMNTPTTKTQHQSDHPKYRDFSLHRMKKLIHIYNNTRHGTTGHTPQEMTDNPQLEKDYIVSRLYDRERRRMQVDFELEPGTFVRYILPKDPHMKRRYRVSPEAYKISHRDGNSYALIARDGTVKTVSRWRLVPLGSTLPENMKFGNTFGNNNGTVQEILDYNPQTHRYTVLFNMPDGTTFQDRIHESYLRGALPQVPSEIERQYRENHT